MPLMYLRDCMRIFFFLKQQTCNSKQVRAKQDVGPWSVPNDPGTFHSPLKASDPSSFTQHSIHVK